MRAQPGRPFLEAVSAEANASFVVRHSRPRRFTFGWHYHPAAELTLIVGGSGLRFVGDSIETFEPGDLVLLGGGVPHTWQSHAGDAAAESIYIQFPPELFVALGMPELDGARRLLRDADRGLRVTPGPARDDAKRHVRAAAAAPAGSASRLIALLGALDAIDRGARRPLSAAATLARANDASTRDLRRVLDRLRQALAAGDAFGQADAAALAGRSPASFSRFFRRHVGRSFVRYVNEWRVGLACRALVQGDASITAIAFDCGFGNLSNFNRRFRQFKGVTPGTFRRAARPAHA